ncbi:hypothetical protein BCIN_06g01560 [Botrytis cinerea B05.10]|uniref:Uncharacterized protein n=1 Tax=Botryotinia fuckeliana (strain B05.10) TaxID=332648 RepID=A0A384JJC8_BOTFB|nr:hypothetical protein BCIN_06g01560 [Botrytis cinerea B05.10]ATZ50663.1 hypothetical protein BCIN_06g01560 [Botrytis cinerea B05.10]
MASSSRVSNRRAERQQQAPEPIKGFAFTVRGVALEDGFENRGVKTTICASSEKKNQFQELKVKAQNGEEGILRDKPEFTSRELGGLEAGLSAYLVVGYVLLEEDHNRAFDQSETNKKQPVGIKQPKKFRKFDDKTMPILVVTEVIDAVDENYQMRYYALMCPKNGISTPQKVKMDYVYFFHEFRDLETSLKTRKTTWGRLALAAAVRPDVLAAPTKRQVDFKRSKATSKLIFERQISLANHLILLAQSFAANPNKAILDDIDASVKDAIADFQHRPPPSCVNIRNFCEVPGDISIEEARGVVAEVQSLWPELGEVRWETIRLIKRGLDVAEIVLEYRLVRAVIAEGDHLFRHHSDFDECPSEIEEVPSEDGEGRMDQDGVADDTVMPDAYDEVGDEALASKVEGIVSTAGRMIPLPESTMSILTKGDRTILGGVVKKLKELLRAIVDGDQTILDACGDTTLGAYSIHEIWGKFSDAIDTDTCKMAFMTVVKRLMMHLMEKNRGVRDMLEELILLLDRLLEG